MEVMKAINCLPNGEDISNVLETKEIDINMESIRGDWYEMCEEETKK